MEKIKYTSGYKYVVQGNYQRHIGIFPPQDIKTKFVSLTKDGLLTILDGFASDGPSGPTVDSKSGMRGSFEHDAVCYLIRAGLLGKEWYHKANENFRDVLLEDGMWRVRAWLWYRGVETDMARTEAMKPRKIYTAP